MIYVHACLFSYKLKNVYIAKKINFKQINMSTIILTLNLFILHLIDWV